MAIEMELKKRKNCNNCGAPLPAGYGQVICPYCGTVYTFDAVGQVVTLVNRPGVIPLRVMQLVDMDIVNDFGKETILDHMQKDMASQLAEMVMRNMRFEIKEDYMQRRYEMRASVRILDNRYAF